MCHSHLRVAGLLLGTLLPARAAAEAIPDPAARLDQAIAAAESGLRENEVQIAESRYRSALFEGWLVMGTLDAVEGRLPEAREAFRSASISTVENTLALRALALEDMRTGEVAEAVTILTRLARKDPKDLQSRRLLAQALEASGQPDRALKELEEARATAPGDLELAFALAGAYLGAKNVDAAARLFAQVVQARPIPQTRVLIGRTYRDAGEYERARVELRAALKQDPRVRHAHYYLGMMIVAEKGRDGLEEAIPEFQAEVKLAPTDPLANLELGVALTDTLRPEEGLPALEIAARAEPPQARTFYYLGRAQFRVDRPAEAVASLKRALELVQQQEPTVAQLRAIRNQLGQALQRLGPEHEAEAAAQFAESERLSIQGSQAEREQMERFLAQGPEPQAAKTLLVPVVEDSPLQAFSPSDRADLRRRVTAGLARAYLNLGVIQVPAGRFSRAAEFFEKAAAVDPDFPQVQSSLGVAYFNAGDFDKATGPLTRALEANPQDAGLRRMLAMAWLDTQTYDKAADLLRGDLDRDANPSLQFAYGLALVKSGRAAEAEPIFARLLAQHGDSAELSVLMGQAHAQRGDFESAVEYLQHALRLKADVAEANGSLGVIYQKQGRLPEAEAAFRAELKGHPDDLQSQQNLAVVLDMEQHSEEAIGLLRSVLRSKPDSADARYLLGKILLAQGAAADAVEHLEAAARLAPKDANVRYQLGRAYQQLGRADQAKEQFDAFRQLKSADKE
jgi:tetratricopeptide (TPR) repeat protein